MRWLHLHLKARVLKPATTTWRRFVALFAGSFAAALGAAYAFVLLVDPYDVVPFSLPFERTLVSISYPFMYPQVVRSGKFDSLIVGTSTSRLLDPAYIGKSLDVRLANLAINSMTAWEQKTMVEYFKRHVGPPKMLIVAADGVWCHKVIDLARHNPGGWPDWLYDDNRWNDFLYLLNEPTLEIAVRLVGNKLGLYRERVRFDGFEVFTPPEHTYDAERARQEIWRYRKSPSRPRPQPSALTGSERPSPSFPALEWLEQMMSGLPEPTLKVIAFMPVHVAAQPPAGTKEADVEAECKARIAKIGKKFGAKVVDWRIPSPITREDENYWDNLHYRLPIAERLQREMVDAIRNGRESSDGSYRILVQ